MRIEPNQHAVEAYRQLTHSPRTAPPETHRFDDSSGSVEHAASPRPAEPSPAPSSREVAAQQVRLANMVAATSTANVDHTAAAIRTGRARVTNALDIASRTVDQPQTGRFLDTTA